MDEAYQSGQEFRREVDAKLDKILLGQEEIRDRLTHIEAQDSSVRLGKLEDKHSELDKRVVSVETRSMMFSSGVSLVIAAVVSWIFSLFKGGPA